jgi:hypothetical protein
VFAHPTVHTGTDIPQKISPSFAAEADADADAAFHTKSVRPSLLLPSLPPLLPPLM